MQVTQRDVVKTGKRIGAHAARATHAERALGLAFAGPGNETVRHQHRSAPFRALRRQCRDQCAQGGIVTLQLRSVQHESRNRRLNIGQ